MSLRRWAPICSALSYPVRCNILFVLHPMSSLLDRISSYAHRRCSRSELEESSVIARHNTSSLIEIFCFRSSWIRFSKSNVTASISRKCAYILFVTPWKVFNRISVFTERLGFFNMYDLAHLGPLDVSSQCKTVLVRVHWHHCPNYLLRFRKTYYYYLINK